MAEFTFGILLAAAIDANYLCVESEEGHEYEIHISDNWERGIILLTDGCAKFNIEWKNDGTDGITMTNMENVESIEEGFEWIGAHEHLELARKMDESWENFQEYLWDHIDNRRHA